MVSRGSGAGASGGEPTRAEEVRTDSADREGMTDEEILEFARVQECHGYEGDCPQSRIVRALLERARRAEGALVPLWECPVCAFTMDACHVTAATGQHDCPNCETERQAERIRLLEQEVAALTEANGIYKRTAKEVIERQGAEVLALRAKTSDESAEADILHEAVRSLEAEVAALKADLRDASEHVARLQAEALKIEGERDRLRGALEEVLGWSRDDSASNAVIGDIVRAALEGK